ncbi:MAG: bifunctional folylpolyglutamate synthase/dihydrofolate synthase [Candidatus Aminicenantes bacterium]|nr:bifunctional folylpolyglutamate synthase/dihydrofolate synthase [Candidatus Aminicenantes bacterium]
MCPLASYPYLDQAQLFGIRLGLENIQAVLEDFGHPHRDYPVIHVAGTNGKGSVCAMLEEIFRLHGYRTGLYTSPHLVDVRERIRVNGSLIREKELKELLAEIEKREKRLKSGGRVAGALTYFEILTIAAFLYFARKKVDLAVLEVGMGGRFDATNVVRPEVSVITTVSYDHQQYLGSNLEKIAFEKAGIIKERIPCVCGVRSPEALRVIKKKCHDEDAPLVRVFDKKREFSVVENRRGEVFIYRTDSSTYKFRPSLPGQHQGENAAVAIATSEVMSARGWKLSKKKIIQGVESASWPGRLEIFGSTPPVVLDGCHNEAGARVVNRFWRKTFNRPAILVFGVMKDKEIEKIARWLFPLASRVILTRPSLERAAGPLEIAARLPGYRDKFFLEETVPSALRLALVLSGGEVPVLVAGSLFLVGEARQFFQSQARTS